MKIETKYDIGQRVWFNPYRPTQGRIAEYRKTKTEELYGVRWWKGRAFTYISECWIALTKEELLKSLE